MLNAQDIYEIAKSYQAEITAGRQIQWRDMGCTHGQWEPMTQYRPSVMDSLILDRAWRVPGYLAAARAATGWPTPILVGFLEAMAVGKPLETKKMHMEDFQYWKGLVIGLMVIQKLKSRLWEAESLFT
jgi:hypothetical protein